MEYNWQLTEESGIWYIIETKPNTLGVLQERIMTDKELKRLSRTDLLNMMLNLSKENDDLRRRLAEAEEKLNSREIAIEESGSLAEAALRLNGIFEAAQAACDQYTQNLKERSENIEQYCADMERQTREKCEKMMADAQRTVNAYLAREAQKIRQMRAAQNQADV